MTVVHKLLLWNVDGHIVEYAVRAGHPVCMISNHNFTMPSADTHLLATVFTTIASATVIVYRCQVIMKCQDF